MTRVRIAGVAAFLTAAVPVGAATAATPPGLPSSVAQYQEQIPTSTGSTSVAHALGQAHKKTLAPTLVTKIREQAPSDASTLLTIGRSAAAKPAPSTTARASTHAAADRSKRHQAKPTTVGPTAPTVAAARSVGTQSASWIDHHTWSVLLRLGVALLVLAAAIALVRRRSA